MRIPDEPWSLAPVSWHSFHVLCHWQRDDRYSVWLFWSEETWQFDGWYVNLQSPFERTALGFDATDDILDIEVEPDGSWKWKDQDELEDAVREGLLTPVDAAAIRREGERAVRRIKGGDGAFATRWTRWRPDERWKVPSLPDGWESQGVAPSRRVPG